MRERNPDQSRSVRQSRLLVLISGSSYRKIIVYWQISCGLMQINQIHNSIQDSITEEVEILVKFVIKLDDNRSLNSHSQCYMRKVFLSKKVGITIDRTTMKLIP